ncbi:hypothetical protein HYC85_027012 [Camellia sinensis]|uniref:Uncharacterized protein n=1 Tax=Camellia sinensis TaxID=4442 RepID=A0A7J7G565_CAMSI|nr:hypothetical protein HYC85_027012 [Camellia sinensis]
MFESSPTLIKHLSYKIGRKSNNLSRKVYLKNPSIHSCLWLVICRTLKMVCHYWLTIIPIPLSLPIRKVPRIQLSREANQGREDNDDNVGAKAACYLSANLMKLITKSVDNYMRSIDRIAKGFFSFYKTSSFTVAILSELCYMLY